MPRTLAATASPGPFMGPSNADPVGGTTVLPPIGTLARPPVPPNTTPARPSPAPLRALQPAAAARGGQRVDKRRLRSLRMVRTQASNAARIATGLIDQMAAEQYGRDSAVLAVRSLKETVDWLVAELEQDEK